jgi:hypothetical protein
MGKALKLLPDLVSAARTCLAQEESRVQERLDHVKVNPSSHQETMALGGVLGPADMTPAENNGKDPYRAYNVSSRARRFSFSLYFLSE